MGTLFTVDGTTGNLSTAGSISSSGGDFTLQNQHSIIFDDTEGVPKSVTLHAPTTITSSYNLNWPIAQASGTQILQNDGSGNLSWATISNTPPGDVSGAVQFNNSGSFGGNNAQFNWDNTGFNLNLTSRNGTIIGDTLTGSNLNITTGTSLGSSSLNGGNIVITTGTGNTGGNNNGGGLTITTGDGATNQMGGSIVLSTGTVSGGSNSGGNITLTTSSGGTPQVGGNIILTAGTPANGGNLYLTGSGTNHGQIGIGTSSPNSTASLEIVSTTRGFLPPRMTTTQRTAISSPAEGLIIYDTTLHQLWEYQNGAWAEVGGGSAPGGSNGNIQFNSSGSFGGTNSLIYALTDGGIASTLTLSSDDSGGEEYRATFNIAATSSLLSFNTQNLDAQYALLVAGNIQDYTGNGYGNGLSLEINAANWVFTGDGAIVLQGLVSSQRDALGAVAHGQFHVEDYTALSGATITVGSSILTEGVDWTAAISNDATAASITNAINKSNGEIDTLAFFGGPGSGKSNLKALVSGTAGNSVVLSSSDPTNLVVSGSTLSGGTNVPTEGTTIYNTDTHQIEFYDGTEWGHVNSTVASVALTAQGADIPTTTIYTATETGLYVVSGYIITTTVDAGAGLLTTTLNWSDDTGPVSLPTWQADLTTLNPTPSFAPMTLELVNGSVLQYSATGGGTYGAAQYSIYLSVQKLS